MEYKKIILLTFVFLFAINFVSSAPTPFLTGENGIEIGYRPIENLRVGEEYRVHIHAFNKTTSAVLKNDTISCFYHLYNRTGWDIDAHDLEFEAYNDVDFAYTIAGGNFTQKGDYSIFIQCNQTAGTDSGYVTGFFHVNTVGETLTTSDAIFYLGGISIMIFFFMVTVIASNKLPSGNRRDGELVSISYLKYLKSVLYVMAYGMLMVIAYFLGNVFEGYFITELGANIFLNFYQFLGFLLVPMLFIWVIWIFVSIFQDRKMKQLLDRGIMEDYNTI